ncbi:MAG: hypothetical protein ABSG59_20645 [Verrucomicrobiota bacterium]
MLLMQWKTLDFRRQLAILTAWCCGRFENADWTGVAQEARIFKRHSQRVSPCKLAYFHFIVIVKGLTTLDLNGVIGQAQIGPRLIAPGIRLRAVVCPVRKQRFCDLAATLDRNFRCQLGVNVRYSHGATGVEAFDELSGRPHPRRAVVTDASLPSDSPFRKPLKKVFSRGGAACRGKNAFSACPAVPSRKVVQLKQNVCHKGTQRSQGQEFIFFNFCDLCDLSWQFIFGCGSAALCLMRSFAANPCLKKISKNSALFPPVGFSPSWKCDQLLRVKAWMMPLSGISRVDQAGAQTARATLFRPLLPGVPLLAIPTYRVEDIQPAAPPPNGSSFSSTPRFALITVRRTPRCVCSIHLSFNALRSSRPTRETSGPMSHINTILLFILSSIRTPDKLLTLFFPFPSFYERQTPFPSPFSPPCSKPVTGPIAPITIDKFSMATTQCSPLLPPFAPVQGFSGGLPTRRSLSHNGADGLRGENFDCRHSFAVARGPAARRAETGRHQWLL